MNAKVYDWVKRTREEVFAYCASLPAEVYVRESDEFGWGSLRNTHVHTADCYRFWLAEETLGAPMDRFGPRDYPDVAAVRQLFARVDDLVAAFIARFPGARLERPLARKVSWQPEPLVVSPLWLLTHTVTHEFHHKGQMVTMGRILGYAPPETDLALPR